MSLTLLPLCVLFGGCQVMFGSQVPEPYVPEHLSPMESGTAAMSSIARALDRPKHLAIDLASALELAGGRSPEVELARIKERQAENVTFSQRFALLPGITPLFRAFSHKGQAQ